MLYPQGHHTTNMLSSYFQGAVHDTQWQRAISERGEVVCPTCSIVTRKTIHGLKKHMEICQKVSGRYSSPLDWERGGCAVTTSAKPSAVTQSNSFPVRLVNTSIFKNVLHLLLDVYP